MTDVLQFALLGLGTGAIYALLGQGLVLIFRGSGVLNLAHGAFAMAGGYVFYELHAVQGLSTAPAIVLTMAATAALGIATDQLLLRRLRRASALARLIGTMAVLLVVQSAAILRYGEDATLVAPLFTPEPVEILGATVTSDRLWIVAIAVALTVALTALTRFTKVGWVMTAVAENERSASALGWSPQRVSVLTWAAGSALAGLAGILIAPITQLSVTNLSLLVIPALAAALIGGFTSFSATLLGGLLLGVGESEVSRYVDLTGASSALPFVVIAVVLLLRGSSLPLRGHVSDRLPMLGVGRVSPRLVLPTVAVAVLLIGFVFGEEWLSAAMVCLSVAIILLSLVVVTGYAGQLSLAQYALAGVGALLTARLVSSYDVPFVVALVLGVAGTVAVGLLFALPALRTRGVDLAVVTLGLGVAAQQLLFNNADVTGTASGTPIGSPSIFGFDIDAIEHPVRYALFTLVLFVLAAIAVANLRRGRSGRRMIAVRANERAAAALGINVLHAKLHAFGISGALAGLGGILLAFQAGTVVYEGFGPVASINAVAEAVVGGIGFVIGPLVGAVLSPGSVGQQITGLGGSEGARYLPLIGGLGLIKLLLLEPNGAVRAFLRGLRATGRARRADAAPVLERVAPRRVAPKTLRIRDLTVCYGGVVGVDGVDLDVRPGKILGLIGPNGAGKTSIIDGISGFTRTAGAIELDGASIAGWSATRRARAGVVRSFQSLELFEDMTVLENLQAASDPRDHRALVSDLISPGRAVLPPMAIAAVHEFGLDRVLTERPEDLSYGQRRLVGIARAVAMEPSVLLLDEPVAGLDETESREFATLVRRLADEWGIAILVIEHDMEFIMGISDQMVVVNFGKQIASGMPEEIRFDPAAIAAYLGDAADDGAEVLA